MSQSTDGEISYGIVFEEGFEFPWDDEAYDGDMDDWWLVVSGWKWEGDEPFTEEGDYAQGLHNGHPTIRAYYDSRSDWRDSHPLPVNTVNYCSGDYPMYALIVPSSLITANRGFPVSFNPDELTVSEEDKNSLLSFCLKYGIEHENEPSWLLTSYWG